MGVLLQIIDAVLINPDNLGQHKCLFSSEMLGF